MSIQFRLTLATEAPIDQLARLAVEDPDERPVPTTFSDRVLRVDLYEQRGFNLSISAGEEGYYDAEGDEGSRWEWKPARYVDLTFSMGKDDLSGKGKGIPSMLEIVGRVLQGTTEDAALAQDGNWLYLTRTNGSVRKYRRATFWDHYAFANQIIPD